MCRNAKGTSNMPMKLPAMCHNGGGRLATISGSRPTTIVLVWWRAGLHRHTVGSRMIMKQAISYTTEFIHLVLNAVPCPHSCPREPGAQPYSTPYTAKHNNDHPENHRYPPSPPNTISSASHSSVPRIAGP